jgi:CheY-like chemotaxis protein
MTMGMRDWRPTRRSSRPAPPFAAPPSAVQRILIAEDDALQGALLQQMLQNHGYQAEIVGDGLEAVRRLRTGRYDLALLDYHLPEVDGLAAAHLLRDFLETESRPRLIAVTAAAEDLHDKEVAFGSTPFDAVVQKRQGLPALLAVIHANLTIAAELNKAAALELGKVALLDAAFARRRPHRAALAALPALVLTGALVAGFGWAAMSLYHVDAAIGSVLRADALGNDTGILVNAMHDAESSQRAYLVTGAQEHRELFEADMQRVDQLLVSSAPLSADGAPGAEIGSGFLKVIEPRLHMLAEEAQMRAAASIQSTSRAAPFELGRDASGRLQDWAADLVTRSQSVAIEALDGARHNATLVLLALATGAAVGLWTAVQAVRLRWREAKPVIGLTAAGKWHLPRLGSLPAPPAAPPLLLREG